MEKTFNPILYLCPKTNAYYAPDSPLLPPYTYDHSALVIINDNLLYQRYEYPPYRIIIRKHDAGPTTTVQIINNQLLTLGLGSNYFFRDVFTIAGAWNLPWNDADQVLKKIALYVAMS